ncbi:RecX family-domain-containing protein [Haematococcus lacustris]
MSLAQQFHLLRGRCCHQLRHARLFVCCPASRRLPPSMWELQEVGGAYERREPPAAEAFPDDASSLVEGHRRPHPAPHPLPSQVRPHNSKRPDTQRSKRPDVAIADPPQQQSQSWPGEQARKPSVRQQALARAMAISASSSSAASATQAEDPPNPAGLERERVRQAALARALSSLARRPLTCKQMSEKLEEWDYHAALAAEVVADLQRTGDLDDASYAQRYVEGKWRVYKRSPALLHQELNSKGVSAAHIDNALCSLFGDGWRDSNNLVSRGEDDASQAAFKDICAEFGTHSTEAAAARPLSHDLKDAVLAQQSRLKGLPLATQTRRLQAWMQRRGHSWSTCKSILTDLGYMD